MDSIVGFLDGPRARDAFVLRSVLDAPWALRIQDEAPLSVMLMVRNGSWVRYDDAEPVNVGTGTETRMSSRGSAPSATDPGGRTHWGP